MDAAHENRRRSLYEFRERRRISSQRHRYDAVPIQPYSHLGHRAVSQVTFTLAHRHSSCCILPAKYLRFLQFFADHSAAGARFTKYLTTISRLSYDNAKVTIDLRWTSKVQNILRRTQGFSYVQFTCKIVRSSKIVFVN